MILSEKSCGMRAGRWLLWLVMAGVIIWAFAGPARQVPVALRGMPFMLDYLLGMIPPDLAVLPPMWQPLLETIRMAIAGTVLSTAIALPLSLLAARNTAPSHAVQEVTRGLLSFLRAMPAMIWAMLFVSLSGLGSLAGILGITCHATGAIGKMFLECIEATGPKIEDVLEAMRLDGATEAQAIRWGIIPEVLPLFASYVLYRLESVIRTSSILGLVGAGGLGLELTMAIRMFRRQEALAIILLVLVLVATVDSASGWLRRYVLKRSGY